MGRRKTVMKSRILFLISKRTKKLSIRNTEATWSKRVQKKDWKTKNIKKRDRGKMAHRNIGATENYVASFALRIKLSFTYLISFHVRISAQSPPLSRVSSPTYRHFALATSCTHTTTSVSETPMSQILGRDEIRDPNVNHRNFHLRKKFIFRGKIASFLFMRHRGWISRFLSRDRFPRGSFMDMHENLFIILPAFLIDELI